MRVQDFVRVQASQSEAESALAISQRYKNALNNPNKGFNLQTLNRHQVSWAVPLSTATLAQLKDSSDVHAAGQCTKSKQVNP